MSHPMIPLLKFPLFFWFCHTPEAPRASWRGRCVRLGPDARRAYDVQRADASPLTVRAAPPSLASRVGTEGAPVARRLSR